MLLLIIILLLPVWSIYSFKCLFPHKACCWRNIESVSLKQRRVFASYTRANVWIYSTAASSASAAADADEAQCGQHVCATTIKDSQSATVGLRNVQLDKKTFRVGNDRLIYWHTACNTC